MPEQRIIVNGINALTGEYLVSPMTLAEAASRARGTGPPKEQHSWLKKLANRLSGRFFGVPADVDTLKIGSGSTSKRKHPRRPTHIRSIRHGECKKEFGYFHLFPRPNAALALPNRAYAAMAAARAGFF